MTVRLETERLVIRSVVEGDAAPIAAIWADPEVTRWLGGPREPEKVIASVLEAAKEPPALDLWTVEHEGRTVGNCGLVEKEIAGRQEIEIAYVLATEVQGRGLATEAGAAVRDHAFGPLGLKRLVALAHPENAPSARVAEKLGFVFEREVPRPGGRVLRLYGLER